MRAQHARPLDGEERRGSEVFERARLKHHRLAKQGQQREKKDMREREGRERGRIGIAT